MFNFFKKKEKEADSGLPDKLLKWLNEADAVYIYVYQTRDMTKLKKYFTRDCCMKLMPIIAAEGASRYFSTDKFRTTTWMLKSKDETTMCVTKSVDYKDIKVAGNTRMKVSTDYSEDWTVMFDPEQNLVSAVVPIPDDL